MTNQNLYLRLVGDRFEKAAEQPFLITTGRLPLLFSELHRMSGLVAARLQQLDVGPGDRVMVQVAKSPESVLVYLACLRVGAIYIPLNTAYTPAEVSYFILLKMQNRNCLSVSRESGRTWWPVRRRAMCLTPEPWGVKAMGIC